MTIFNYPPTPLPDEHVASLIFRCFQRTKHLSIESYFYYAKTTFFDKPSRGWVDVYTAIAQSVSEQYSIPTFISSFTNVTDYSLFLEGHVTGNTTQEILKCLATQSFRGSLQVQSDRSWRYCSVCATEDEDKFGTSYLHTAHQRYYRNTCKKHGQLLQTIDERKFDLPPSSAKYKCADPNTLALDAKLEKLVERVQLVPASERKVRLLSALHQKFGAGTAHPDIVKKTFRAAHDILVEGYNNSPFTCFFVWNSLASSMHPLTLDKGLPWMILPNLNLHPLYYFWFIETFFTEDEFEKVMSIPLIEKQGVNALPIVLEPISIKTNGFSYAA